MDFTEKKKINFGRFSWCEHEVDEQEQAIVSDIFYQGKKISFSCSERVVFCTFKKNKCYRGAKKMIFFGYQLLMWMQLRVTFPKNGNWNQFEYAGFRLSKTGSMILSSLCQAELGRLLLATKANHLSFLYAFVQREKSNSFNSGTDVNDITSKSKIY